MDVQIPRYQKELVDLFFRSGFSLQSFGECFKNTDFDAPLAKILM